MIIYRLDVNKVEWSGLLGWEEIDVHAALASAEIGYIIKPFTLSGMELKYFGKHEQLVYGGKRLEEGRTVQYVQ